jgi:hypothetical protein
VGVFFLDATGVDSDSSWLDATGADSDSSWLDATGADASSAGRGRGNGSE